MTVLMCVCVCPMKKRKEGRFFIIYASQLCGSGGATGNLSLTGAEKSSDSKTLKATKIEKSEIQKKEKERCEEQETKLLVFTLSSSSHRSRSDHILSYFQSVSQWYFMTVSFLAQIKNSVSFSRT